MSHSKMLIGLVDCLPSAYLVRVNATGECSAGYIRQCTRRLMDFERNTIYALGLFTRVHEAACGCMMVHYGE
jgi:hypothetical protein